MTNTDQRILHNNDLYRGSVGIDDRSDNSFFKYVPAYIET